MSEAFAIKLVIDDLTCPSLFARLSVVESRRKRAALLRAIAEAACRGTHIDVPRPDATNALSDVRSVHIDIAGQAKRDVESAAVVGTSIPTDGRSGVWSVDAHDTDAIADELAGFF